MMDGLLKQGQMLVARNMESAVVIEDVLGEGAQAEVYRARIGDSCFAVKWYKPEYLGVDSRLWDRLKVAIDAGSPTEQFLWPFDFVSLPRTTGYRGYLMPIKPPEYISMVDLLRRQCEPAFRALTMVGFNLANSFLKLHAEGLCYRDMNFGNVFFHPDTGDIRIADTDNVDVNLKAGGIKAPRVSWLRRWQRISFSQMPCPIAFRWRCCFSISSCSVIRSRENANSRCRMMRAIRTNRAAFATMIHCLSIIPRTTPTGPFPANMMPCSASGPSIRPHCENYLRVHLPKGFGIRMRGSWKTSGARKCAPFGTPYFIAIAALRRIFIIWTGRGKRRP
jgi:hypothetical protein